MDFHERITKLVFMNSSVNDLIWRRLIKISMLNFRADSRNSQLWTSKNLKPMQQPIDYDKVQLMESSRYQTQGSAPTIYMQSQAQKEIMPEDSISGVHELMGTSLPLKAINKSSINANTALLEDYIKKGKTYDFKFDDFYYKDPKSKTLIFQEAAGIEINQTLKNPKGVLEKEMKRLGEFEE